MITTTILIVLTATLFLAYANGANDNFKGVATLTGCGTADYRTALWWATGATLAGSLLATVLAAGLIKTFSGQGLAPDAVIGEPAFLAAVGLAAAATVMIATVTGLPISTTHALMGALVGAGLVATGGDLQWSRLGTAFVVPLLVSPLLAVTFALGLYPPLRYFRKKLGVTSPTCVCLDGGELAPTVAGPGGVLQFHSSGSPVVVVDDSHRCVERYRGHVFGFSCAAAADKLHYLSAAAVSFARGLNDTPKIAALLLSGGALASFGSGESSGRYVAFIAVAIFIAVGGLLSARKVARTMSHKITDMNVGQALTANIVTAVLVTVASRFGMPVSTTHISCGSLFGIGVVTRQAKGRTILTIVLAWVTTLPLAALMGGGCYYVLAAVMNK